MGGMPGGMPAGAEQMMNDPEIMAAMGNPKVGDRRDVAEMSPRCRRDHSGDPAGDGGDDISAISRLHLGYISQVMAALQQCMSNPMAAMQYMNDPEVGDHSRDVAERWPRDCRDVAERLPRDSREIAERQPRYSRDHSTRATRDQVTSHASQMAQAPQSRESQVTRYKPQPSSYRATLQAGPTLQKIMGHVACSS